MFEALLQKIARGLDSRKIPYMLIGGQAVLVYGEPRLTRDVDVTLGVGPEKLDTILDWVRESGWRVLVESAAAFVAQTYVLPCVDEASGIRIDFIFSISNFERQAIERAKSMEVQGTPVRFASAEDVIIHKIVAGRPRDIEDVRSILLKQPGVDAAYVRQWLSNIEPERAGEFLARFEEQWLRCRDIASQ